MITTKPGQILAAMALAATVVALIGAFTNEIDTQRFPWDSRFYMGMAENGLTDNNDLVAPFAYRFVTPLIVHFLSRFAGLSAEAGFRLIAYAGAVAQLFSAFLLVTAFGFTFRAAVAGMLATGFSLFNVKFLLFDIYRPDHLAHPLLILAFIALAGGHTLWTIGLSVVGLQVREFLIIPGLIRLGQLSVGWVRERSLKALLRCLLVGAVLTLGVLVPRLLIQVGASDQFVDPFNKPRSLSRLISAPLNLRRDFNLLFVTVAYALPLLITCTRVRLAAAAVKMRPTGTTLLLYAGCVLLLAIYGGTDLGRFVAYLFIPQILLLACLIDEGVGAAEVAYMLTATFIFNRIAFHFPAKDLSAYLDFCLAYNDRIAGNFAYRLAELAALVAGGVLLRMIVPRNGVPVR